MNKRQRKKNAKKIKAIDDYVNAYFGRTTYQYWLLPNSHVIPLNLEEAYVLWDYLHQEVKENIEKSGNTIWTIEEDHENKR